MRTLARAFLALAIAACAPARGASPLPTAQTVVSDAGTPSSSSPEGSYDGGCALAEDAGSPPCDRVQQRRDPSLSTYPSLIGQLQRLAASTAAGTQEHDVIVARLAATHLEWACTAHRDCLREPSYDSIQLARHQWAMFQEACAALLRREEHDAWLPLCTGEAPASPPAQTLVACVQELRAAGQVPSGDPGAARYHEARKLEAADELPAAKKAYAALIREFPRSGYVPFAHLALGELAAASTASAMGSRSPALTRAGWSAAGQSFRSALGFAPPSNPARAYAQLMEAQMWVESAVPRRALESARKAFRVSREPSQRCGDQVRAAATELMLQSYFEVEQPAHAWAYFSGAPETRDAALDLCQRLANHYEQRSAPARACEVIGSIPAEHRPKAGCAP